MLYPQPGVRKYVFFVTYGAPKTYSFICSNKYFKQQKEKEYVLVCLPYVTRMYSYYVIRMSFICTPMSSVCHSYVLVCHPYVTRMYSYVIRMSLVSGFTMSQKRGLETIPPSLVLNIYRTSLS